MMEEKFINLLLKKCLSVSKSKSLFISYDVINSQFIYKLVDIAKKIGYDDIYLDEDNVFYEHDLLKKLKLDEIDTHPYFDKSIRNLYALNNSNFLIFRAPIPNLMDDISEEKLARAAYIKNKKCDIFRKKQLNYEIPWCLSVLPNIYWANNIFKNNDKALTQLENEIYRMCLINNENPIKSWEDVIKKNRLMIDKLNNLKIKMLSFKNSLGTDLKIELLEDSIWCDASTNGLVNMPSYEIFTTPNYKKTSGIVYSSKPLVYNGGKIDQFWIKFKDGKAIDCAAKIGEKLLNEIISSDSNSCYLGECALVEYNSPISKTNLVYGLTLIDENASCHLALGEGFKECLKNSNQYSDTDLLNKGINFSNVHVDFMIGTSDLDIVAETFDKKKIKIMENGNFVR